VKTFHVFMTLNMDLQSDVFRDDIRNRIAALDAEKSWNYERSGSYAR
jgi:hypothetical protein